MPETIMSTTVTSDGPAATGVNDEPPPACLALWRRARAAGLPLGRLSLVTCPSSAPRLVSGWNRASGDVWVLHSGDAGETLRRLLRELARAERHTPAPTTIDADWNEEIAIEHRARELALRWDVASAFADAPLAARLASLEMQRERHHLAADLAPTRDPLVARAAYDALRDLASEKGWSDTMFEAALCEADEDDAVNVALVDVDRSRLRMSWHVGHGVGGTFGALACTQDTRSARTLRDALSRAGRLTTDWHTRSFVVREHGPRRTSLLRTLTEAAELPEVISAAQALMLARPDACPTVFWWCFGEPASPVRLYQLGVNVADEIASLSILVRARHQRDRIVEAALQRYIRSWSRVAAIRTGSFADGLTALWTTHG